MNPLNPIFAIIIYCIAFVTAYFIQLKYKISTDNTRYENIDALRGFLALGVFICHASVWHQYLQIGSWEIPKSNLYTHLGQTSVAFFFMITAFLFVSKLLNANEKGINWKALFISRFFRLTPMYLVSIALVTLIVLVISDWQLKSGAVSFAKDLFYWSTFTIFSGPNINENEFTSIINAGVIWSLPYEWLFYFSLPLMALLMLKKKPSIYYILISLVFVIVYFRINGFEGQHLVSFMGGAITPFILKYGNKKINYNTIVLSIVVVICLGLILQFKTSSDWACKILIVVVFNLIALGNTIFGILKSTILKFLGEICYSTYLIHGIVLFVVLYFGFGLKPAAQLSPLAYCLTVFVITPFVVILSFITYRIIEKPCMDFSKKIRLTR